MSVITVADGFLHLAQLAPFTNTAQQQRMAKRLRACHARRFAGVLARAVERICALPCLGESASPVEVARLHYTNGDRHWWITERDAGDGNGSVLHGARGFAARAGTLPAPVLVDLRQVIERGAELDLAFEPMNRDQIALGMRMAS